MSFDSILRSLRRATSRGASALRGAGHHDADLRAEMETHLEMATAERVRRGMAPDEARRQALVEAGGLTQAAERVREQRSLPWLETFAADARYAVRHSRRSPLTTVTMILVLALGIGTNVVLFTILNSLATMPAPGIARDESLVRIRGTLTDASGMQPRLMSWPEVQDYAARGDVFSAVAAWADETAPVETGNAGEAPLTARVVYVTPGYFGILKVRPVLGTPPVSDGDGVRMTTSPTVTISHAMWQQRFGGAPDVIGRTIRINDVPVRIVGVAPERFTGTDGARGPTLWAPLAAWPLLQHRSVATFTSRDSAFLGVAARLRDGVSTDAASPVIAEMAARATHAGPNATAGGDVVPMLVTNARVSQQADLLLSGAGAAGFALLALLITCINVSALLVGLAVARRREIGVRLSLGAPRARLIRQLLTESILLSLAAAAVALALTAGGIRFAGTLLDDVQLVIDWRVTAATCAVAIVTGLLFGVSPALHATRVSVGEVLKGSATAVAASRGRLQRALVVAQIAVTQPLLVGLGVVITTMVTNAGNVSESRVADRIVEIELDTWGARVSDAERVARVAAVVDRVAALPGVRVAVPMQMGTVGMPLRVHPADRVAGGTGDGVMNATLTAAPKGWFEAFDVPIVSGRGFNSAEYAQVTTDPTKPMSLGAVIVGSDLARRLWGRANAVGRRLVVATSDGSYGSPLVVVGVVDAAAAGPSATGQQVRVYVPYAPMNTGVIARTTGPALPMVNAIRQAAATVAPQMPVARAETAAQREARARADRLRTSGAVAVGGLLALFLSAIGLYAVVSLGVGQRTREIGIRTALGAQGSQVVRMFFASGLRLSVIGLALGLPLSMLAARYVAAALRWPLATSPLLGVAIGAIVLVVASAAVWIPSRRASAIDPLVALRSE